MYPKFKGFMFPGKFYSSWALGLGVPGQVAAECMEGAAFHRAEIYVTMAEEGSANRDEGCRCPPRDRRVRVGILSGLCG